MQSYLKETLFLFACFILNFGVAQNVPLVNQIQVGLGNSCEIICNPIPDTIYCNEDLSIVPEPTVIDCYQVYSIQLANETYVDQNFCDDNMLKLERTWRALDSDGDELSSCIQTIVINKTDILFPKDIVWTYEQYAFNSLIIEGAPVHDDIFDLDEYDGENDIDVDPGLSDLIVFQSGSGFPEGGEDASCLYDITYSDSVVIGCKQSFEVLRAWKVIEQCSGVTLTHVQKITINDNSSNLDLGNSTGYVLNNMSYEYHVSVNNNTCKSTDFILFPVFFEGVDTNSIVLTTPLGELVDLTTEGGYIPDPGLSAGKYKDGLKIQVSDFCGNTETMLVTLVVNDSNEPQCNAPQNMSVSCVDFDSDLASYGTLSTANDCGSVIDSMSTFVDWGGYDTECKIGVVTRYWSVWDVDGNSGSCLQKITVVPPLVYNVQFPDDVMDGNIDTIAPFFDGNCGPTSWSVEDVKVIPAGQCLGKVYRTYTTYNDCDLDQNYQPEMIVNSENTTNGTLAIATLQNHGVLSYTQVIDNFCDSRIVSGRVYSEDGVGIKGVVMTATVSNSNQSVYTDSTDEFGQYSLSLPVASSYIIKPEKLDDNYKNGVDMADVEVLYRHILIIPEISSPYKILAANVLANNQAKINELLEIKKLVLNKIDGFDGVPVWTFAESTVNFPKPLNPYSVHYNSYQVIQLQDDADIDFVGIKYGDLNNSVNTLSKNITTLGRSGESAHLSIEDIYLEEGKEYEIPFSILSEKNILSYQFTLDFDVQSLEFLELIVDQELVESDFNLTELKNGLLATAHVGEHVQDGPIFLIKFKAKKSGFLSRRLDLTDKMTACKAFDDDFEQLDFKLNFSPSGAQPTLILFQNEPNPFMDLTTIKFELQKEEQISLTIYSAEGQVVAHKEKTYPSGLHEEIFAGNIFKLKGIYYYRIETPEHVYVKKMIKF